MSGVLAEVAVPTVAGETVVIRPGSLVQGRNTVLGWLEVEMIRDGAGGGFSGERHTWALHCRLPGGSGHYVEIIPSWDLTEVAVPGTAQPAQLCLWSDPEGEREERAS